MRETIEVCPECDSPHIHANNPIWSDEEQPARWRCDCGAKFDSAKTRERRAITGRSGIVGVLADEEVTTIEEARERAREEGLV